MPYVVLKEGFQEEESRGRTRKYPKGWAGSVSEKTHADMHSQGVLDEEKSDGPKDTVALTDDDWMAAFTSLKDDDFTSEGVPKVKKMKSLLPETAEVTAETVKKAFDLLMTPEPDFDPETGEVTDTKDQTGLI